MKGIFKHLNGKTKQTNDNVDETKEEVVDNILLMTYAEILNLKRNGLLDTSKRYRMIDYVTVVLQKNAKSAFHRFDLLLTPVSENEFSCNVKALPHDGDDYFKNSNMGAWRIEYDIENDTDKYDWVDPKNGRGVIYYMNDEHGNAAPYDFKNVMFKRWAVKGETNGNAVMYGNIDRETEIPYSKEIDYEKSEFFYTFSTLRYGNQVLSPTENKSETYNRLWVCDMTVEPFKYPFKLKDCYGCDSCYGNHIKPTYINGKLILSDNVLVGFPSFWERTENGKANLHVSHIDFNGFERGCIGNTLCGNSTYNDFMEDCRYNSLYGHCSSNWFKHKCNANTLIDGSSANEFGDNCSDNTLVKSSNNSFGNSCSGNVLKESIANTFNSACAENNLNLCRYNVFGLGCSRNDMYSSKNNVFGSLCSKNRMADNCSSNVMGNCCIENEFGTNCVNNDFHSNVSFIYLEKDNSYNTFMGNNNFINMHGGIQNLTVNQHIGGTSKEKPLEREIEPAVAYKQEMRINKEGVIEII